MNLHSRILPRSILCCLLVSAMIASVPAQGADGRLAGLEVVDLARFGHNGDLRPTAGESFIDRGFYTQDMTAAAASREYFTALFTLPATVERTVWAKNEAKGEIAYDTEPIALDRVRIGLVLSNPADDLVDVTVSLRRVEGVRNHLVRLEAGDAVALVFPATAAELGRLETMALLAFAPFEASVDLSAASAVEMSQDLSVMAPATDASAYAPGGLAKAINYCQEITSTLRITGATGYVIAKGIRRFVANSSGPLLEIHLHDIEYPAGTLFHKGHGSSGVITDPACKWRTHKTFRVDDSSIRHTWTGMDDLVFACVGPATARCTQGCTGTFSVTLSGSSLGRCF